MTEARATRSRFRPVIWALVLGGLLGGGMWMAQMVRFPRATSLPPGVAQAVVQKVDLDVKLNAPGRVESLENTLIECELEPLRARASGGQRFATSGLCTIIDLLPEGTIVKQGELLCRFDSSEYTEMVRQQTIVVEAARADLRQAELDLQAAEINLKEYLEGTRLAQYKTFEGQIALAESEYQRQVDRLAWADRMLPLGYISSSRYEQERQLLERAEINLERSRDALATYKKYTEFKITQSLESIISRRISTFEYMKSRLEREEDQLAHHQEQLARCEIRAPHDGMLIYANDDDDDPRIQIGSQVTHKMDLFVLPNLEKMEVKTVLNETIVRHVKPGNPAEVTIEALPGVRLKGKVLSVSQLPDVSQYSWRKQDIRQYLARVVLDNPSKILPGMNAEVEIITESRPSTLVVPPEAVAVEEDGDAYCLVTRGQAVERRPVTIERGTIDLLRVTSGLQEGDQVVLNPESLNLDEVVVESEPAPTRLGVSGTSPTEADTVIAGTLTR